MLIHVTRGAERLSLPRRVESLRNLVLDARARPEGARVKHEVTCYSTRRPFVLFSRRRIEDTARDGQARLVIAGKAQKLKLVTSHDKAQKLRV